MEGNVEIDVPVERWGRGLFPSRYASRLHCPGFERESDGHVAFFSRILGSAIDHGVALRRVEHAEDVGILDDFSAL